MSKLLLICGLGLFAAGCAGDFEATGPGTFGAGSEAAEAVAEALVGPRTRSTQGAVYNDVLDTWMMQVGTPQTVGSQAFASAGRTAEPTHYALKIYPKNEEEQWRVLQVQRPV